MKATEQYCGNAKSVPMVVREFERITISPFRAKRHLKGTKLPSYGRTSIYDPGH